MPIVIKYMREGQEPVPGLAKRELYFAAGGRTAPFPGGVVVGGRALL